MVRKSKVFIKILDKEISLQQNWSKFANEDDKGQNEDQNSTNEDKRRETMRIILQEVMEDVMN